MNKAGLGFCGLLIVLGGLGMYLAAQVYAARSASLAKVETARKSFEAAAAELRDKEGPALAAQARVESLEQQWGLVYPVSGENVLVVNPDRGLIELPIGGNVRGFRPGGEQGDPSIHVYALDQGQSRYLGQFNVKAAEANRSTSELRRPPLPGEARDWAADNYRVRTFAPPTYAQLITDLTTDYTIAGEALLLQQDALADMESQARQAQAAIESRLAELGGNAALPETAPSVLRDGLVDTLAQTAADRDEVATDVAERRQMYRDRHDELEELLKQVRALADRLPGASDRPQSQAFAAPAATR